MNKTMRLSLYIIQRGSSPILHCVDEWGEHESGYNLLIIDSARRYGLRPITGVSTDGSFELTDATTSPVVKLT